MWFDLAVPHIIHLLKVHCLYVSLDKFYKTNVCIVARIIIQSIKPIFHTLKILKS